MSMWVSPLASLILRIFLKGQGERFFFSEEVSKNQSFSGEGSCHQDDLFRGGGDFDLPCQWDMGRGKKMEWPTRSLCVIITYF